jgi:HEAT repeat protein
MPLFGPPNVGRLKQRRDVTGLIKALAHRKEAGVRRAAAQALGENPGPMAVEPLIAALKDQDAQVRVAAVAALGRQRDARAAESLAALLRRGVFELREAAAEALGQTGDARAVPPLLGALRDPEHSVRRIAAGALDLLGWEPDRGTDGAAYWVAKEEWARCGTLGAPAIGPLTGVLEDPYFSRDAYRAVAVALGQTGDARALEPLLDALANFEPEVRAAAAEALGQIGDRRAVGPLAAALTNPDPAVREAAARALEVLDWQPDRSGAAAAPTFPR